MESVQPESTIISRTDPFATATTGELLGALAKQSGELVKKEMELAKAELAKLRSEPVAPPPPPEPPVVPVPEPEPEPEPAIDIAALVARCDELGGDPYDADRTGDGVPLARLDAAATIAACTEALAAAGYASAVSGQKTYNGVAILSRSTPGDPVTGIPGFADEQKRVLAATVAGTRVICVYCPNGQAVGSDKYEYKLRWFAALRDYLAGELAAHPRLAVAGDFNKALGFDDRTVGEDLFDGFVLLLEDDGSLRWSAHLAGGGDQRFMAVAGHAERVFALAEMSADAKLEGWYLVNQGLFPSIGLAAFVE